MYNIEVINPMILWILPLFPNVLSGRLDSIFLALEDFEDQTFHHSPMLNYTQNEQIEDTTLDY